MKFDLTKVSLALLSAVFILGCQDLGTAVEAVDLVPQLDKKGTGKCDAAASDGHCHGDEDDTGGDDPGSPFYQYTLTSSVITTDPSTAIGVSGSPSGKQVSLSETQNSGPSTGDEFLELSKDLLLDNDVADRELCFGTAPFITGSWGGHVSPIKQGGNEVWANFLFDATDIAGDTIGYRLRLFGTAVTDEAEGDGIFPPEVGETMTVAFTSYFIEPQRNKEKNACSGAADLDADSPLATSIVILGVPGATLPTL